MFNCKDTRPHGGSEAVPSLPCTYHKEYKRANLGNELTDREKSAHAATEEDVCDFSLR